MVAVSTTHSTICRPLLSSERLLSPISHVLQVMKAVNTMKTAQIATKVSLLAVMAAWLLVGAPLQAADTITITQKAYNNGSNDGQGESFTPSVNDAPPSPAPTTVDLTQFTMQSGGSDAATPVYLHIYTGWRADGSKYGAATGFVGSSTNSVVWPASGWASFSFDNLALDYTTKYYALLSTTRKAGNLTGRAVLLTTENVYAGGGLIVSGAAGYEPSYDLTFTASFTAASRARGTSIVGYGSCYWDRDLLCCAMLPSWSFHLLIHNAHWRSCFPRRRTNCVALYQDYCLCGRWSSCRRRLRCC